MQVLQDWKQELLGYGRDIQYVMFVPHVAPCCYLDVFIILEQMVIIFIY
jgi:hypothetical protein